MEEAQREADESGDKLPDEHREHDLQELWDIKTEIETEGLSRDVRKELRKDRKWDKQQAENEEKFKDEQGFAGIWEKLVPLPQKHKPETANLLDYVPPTLTHESFQFGIPALPVGTQGRKRAVHSVSMAEADIMIPSALTVDNFSFTPAELEEFENSRDELASMFDNIEVPEEPPKSLSSSENFQKSKQPPNAVNDLKKSTKNTRLKIFTRQINLLYGGK